jgi:hypothetical protein
MQCLKQWHLFQCIALGGACKVEGCTHIQLQYKCADTLNNCDVVQIDEGATQEDIDIFKAHGDERVKAAAKDKVMESKTMKSEDQKAVQQNVDFKVNELLYPS